MAAMRDAIVTVATTAAMLALAVLLFAGCEKRDENAAAIQASVDAQKDQQNANAAAASRPTTQQLLEGPTRRIALVVVPLTVEAPESWQVKTLSLNGSNVDANSPGAPGSGLMPAGQQPSASSMSFTELTGPAPAGDVHVQLAMRMPWTTERLERMLRAAQRDADAQRKTAATTATTASTDSTTGAMLKFDIRQQGDVRVMEQQKVMVAPDGGAKVMDWRVTYFVPRTSASALSSPGSSVGGGDFDECDLSFLGLTLDQYQRDQAFLEKIISSVRYDPAGLTVTQPMSTDPLSVPPQPPAR